MGLTSDSKNCLCSEVMGADKTLLTEKNSKAGNNVALYLTEACIFYILLRGG